MLLYSRVYTEYSGRWTVSIIKLGIEINFLKINKLKYNMILLYLTCFPPPEDTARFKKPALLKYRTMNGVAVNVIAILKGAKNL